MHMDAKAKRKEQNSNNKIQNENATEVIKNIFSITKKVV